MPRAVTAASRSSTASLQPSAADAAPLIAETATPRPLSSYGADKLGDVLPARAAWQVFALPTVGLRYFNVFGPGQDPNSPYSGVISKFASALLCGEPATISGDGRTKPRLHLRPRRGRGGEPCRVDRS